MNMKLLRKIANPVPPSDINGTQNTEINNADLIAKLDSEPGYFEQVIRPMLAPGQEGELITWLKNIGLIPQNQRCKNALKNNNCNIPMSWIPASSPDVYQWQCLGCMEKRKIRDDSIFHNVKCKFKDAMRLLLGWSKGSSHEMMADILNIKRPVAKTVYNIASNSARSFIRKQTAEFQLGGPGVVILVDTYPDINSNLGSHEYNSKSRLILCIAEVKEVPTRFYFHSLDRYSKTGTEQIECINVQTLKIVQNIVLPGSVLVGNAHTTICSYDVLKRLQHHYPIIVSAQDLQKHDNPLHSMIRNLEVIWKPALEVCEEAQYCKHSDVPQYLARHLFCQRFGTQTFEVLLNQLSY